MMLSNHISHTSQSLKILWLFWSLFSKSDFEILFNNYQHFWVFQKLECFKTLLNATFKKSNWKFKLFSFVFPFSIQGFLCFGFWMFSLVFFLVFLDSSSLGVTFWISEFWCVFVFNFFDSLSAFLDFWLSEFLIVFEALMDFVYFLKFRSLQLHFLSLCLLAAFHLRFFWVFLLYF